MTPENFVYWLNGFLELTGKTTIGEIEVQMIREHLSLVLAKKTDTQHPNLNFKPTLYRNCNNCPKDGKTCTYCFGYKRLPPFGPELQCNHYSDESFNCSLCEKSIQKIMTTTLSC